MTPLGFLLATIKEGDINNALLTLSPFLGEEATQAERAEMPELADRLLALSSATFQAGWMRTTSVSPATEKGHREKVNARLAYINGDAYVPGLVRVLRSLAVGPDLEAVASGLEAMHGKWTGCIPLPWFQPQEAPVPWCR